MKTTLRLITNIFYDNVTQLVLATILTYNIDIELDIVLRSFVCR